MHAYLDREAKESLYALLERCHPAEVAQLLARLRDGQVNGRSQAACPIAIIAGFRGSDYAASGLSCLHAWPFERWVKAIEPGMTPRTNRCAQVLDAWLVAWLDGRTLELVGAEERLMDALKEDDRGRQ